MEREKIRDCCSVLGAVRGAAVELDGEARYLDVWADRPSRRLRRSTT